MLLIFFQVLYYLILPVLLGKIIVGYPSKISPLKKLSLAYFTGISFEVLFLWFYNLFHFSPQNKKWLPFLLILAALLLKAIFKVRKREETKVIPSKVNRYFFINLIFFFLLGYYLIFRSLLYPVYTYDGTHCYLYRARIMEKYGYFTTSLYQKHKNLALQSMSGIVPGISFLLFLPLDSYGYETIWKIKLFFPLVFLFGLLFILDFSKKKTLLLFFLFPFFLYPLYQATLVGGDLLLGIYLLVIFRVFFEEKDLYFFVLILVGGFLLFKTESRLYFLLATLVFWKDIGKNKKIVALFFIIFSWLILKWGYVDTSFSYDHVHDYFKHFSFSWKRIVLFFKEFFGSGSFLFFYLLIFIMQPIERFLVLLRRYIIVSFIVLGFVYITMENRNYLNRVLLHNFWLSCYYILNTGEIFIKNNFLPFLKKK